MMMAVMVVTQKNMRSSTMAKAFHSSSIEASFSLSFKVSTMYLSSSLILVMSLASPGIGVLATVSSTVGREMESRCLAAEEEEMM